MPRSNWKRSAISTAIGLTALGLAASASAQDAFAVGTVPGDVTSIAPWFAQAANTYANYKVKADVVTIEGGSRGVQVLLSGKIQAMYVGFSVIVNANREGADLRAVAASFNVMPMQMFVSPNIKTPADLKGQKIAISAFSSESDMAVSLALRKWGLTRKDVTVVPLGGQSQRFAAHLSNQVAAAPYILPGTVQARQKGLTMMLDLSNGGSPWVFNGIMVNNDWAKSHADLLKRFIKANVEGVYKGLSDEKWGKEVIGKQFQTDNKEVIDEAYAALKANYPRDFGLSSEAVTNVINEVNTMGPPLKDRNPANYVDNSYIEQLKREGFFDEMKRKYKL